MEGLSIRQKNDLELLKYIAENGIIDLTYVQEQLEMKKRAEIFLLLRPTSSFVKCIDLEEK